MIDCASNDSLQGQLCLIRVHGMPLLGECLSVIPLHLQAGHFQVLDKLTFLQESACYAGRVRHAVVHHCAPHTSLSALLALVTASAFLSDCLHHCCICPCI